MKSTVPRNDFEQLDPDPQIGIRFNTGADMLLATSQTRRHEQMGLAADASPHQTQAPTLDDFLAGAQLDVRNPQFIIHWCYCLRPITSQQRMVAAVVAAGAVCASGR